MSWCPFAKKMELQPESDAQAAIRPVQFIVHSIAAPWTIERLYEYWRDSTNLESHFGLGYDGRLGQYIGTQTRADANAQANARAISLESAANTSNSDPWTDAQINMLVRVMDWAADEHGIPRRKCRSWTDPGFGYHKMFPEWSVGGTACPGPKRTEQFNEIVLPRVIAGDGGGDEDVALTDADVARVATAVVNKLIAGGGVLEGGDIERIFTTDGILKAPADAETAGTNPFWTFASHVQAQTTTARATATDVDEILAQVRSNGALLTEIKSTLAALDLSRVPAEVADKLNGLVFKLEGPA
jgi:hypothetical protein